MITTLAKAISVFFFFSRWSLHTLLCKLSHSNPSIDQFFVEPGAVVIVRQFRGSSKTYIKTSQSLTPHGKIHRLGRRPTNFISGSGNHGPVRLRYPRAKEKVGPQQLYPLGIGSRSLLYNNHDPICNDRGIFFVNLRVPRITGIVSLATGFCYITHTPSSDTIQAYFTISHC